MLRLLTLLYLFYAAPLFAAEALVAAATNFDAALEALAEQYEAATGHHIKHTSGSTGLLFAQIMNGAPYDILLAADQERPRRLADAGVGIAASRFTYARGRLALILARPELVRADLQQTLLQADVRKLAIANPALAPYGVAANEVLSALDARESLSGKIVMGENVGQAYALVVTGNADAGIVALSLLLSRERPGRKDFVEIPASLHAPIRQDAILLARAAGNAAARDFLEFLQSNAALQRIGAFGYGVN